MTGSSAAEADELASRFSASVRASILPIITQDEQDAVRRYQGPDGFYRLLNSVLRGKLGTANLDPEAVRTIAETIATLDDLLSRWSVPQPVLVYRGLEDALGTFGGYWPVQGMTFEDPAFLSTSLFRSVAVAGFAEPRQAEPALLELFVPEGLPAIWVPPIGDSALEDEGELLLGRNTPLLIMSVEQTDKMIVRCQVTP